MTVIVGCLSFRLLNYKMNILAYDGSTRTHWKKENEELCADAVPFDFNVFKLFVYNYERWMYCCWLEKEKRDIASIPMTREHFLVDHGDGIVMYLRKYGDFKTCLKNLINLYVPFRPDLLGGLEVPLWDEGDKFPEMLVTSIEKLDEQTISVYYTHPDGSPMQVSVDELGEDEIENILKALLERDGNNMSALSPVNNLKKPRSVDAPQTSGPEKMYIPKNTNENHYEDVFADEELFETSVL